jgi:hypothetical protein
MARSVWFGFGGALVGVALKVLLDSDVLALGALFTGFLIMVLAHCGVIGKHEGHDAPLSLIDHKHPHLFVSEAPIPLGDPRLYPALKPDHYGMDSNNKESLFIENQGAPADDVSVSLQELIGGWSVTFGDPQRVTSRKLGVFPINISRDNHGCGNRLENIWPDSWKPIDKAVLLHITYRAYDLATYAVDFKLERTTSGFKVTDIGQPATVISDRPGELNGPIRLTLEQQELSHLCVEATRSFEEFKDIRWIYPSSVVSTRPFSKWRPFVNDENVAEDIRAGVTWARSLQRHADHLNGWGERWGKDLSPIFKSELFECIVNWNRGHIMSGDKCELLLSQHADSLKGRLDLAAR